MFKKMISIVAVMGLIFVAWGQETVAAADNAVASDVVSAAAESPLPNIKNITSASMQEGMADFVDSNAHGQLILALALFFGILVVGKFLLLIICGYLKKKGAAAKNVSEVIHKPLLGLILILALYGGVSPYMDTLSSFWQALLSKIIYALICFLITWLIYRFVDIVDLALQNVKNSKGELIDPMLAGIIKRILRVITLFVLLMFLGQNVFGLNITTLLAGAGVAGLAIAFAAQETVANFIGSLMILLDHPFKVGDAVNIDGVIGVVQHVGLRSTTLRSLDGHLVTIPNKTVAGTTVIDISARPSIKTVMNLGLTYDTPPEKMALALAILREVFANHEGMDEKLPARIYFTEFKDYSLNIQVIVWYHPGDYFKNLEFLNASNLTILQRFNAEGLEFAFPTNTTYLAYDQQRKVAIEVNTTQE